MQDAHGLHRFVGLQGGGIQDHYLRLIIIASSPEQTRIPFDKDIASICQVQLKLIEWPWRTLFKAIHIFYLFIFPW